MPKPKAVLIDWVDAISSHGWEAVDNADINKPMTCRSLGWLVHDGKDFVGVAATWSPGQQDESNNRISIPTGWIKRRREVKLG